VANRSLGLSLVNQSVGTNFIVVFSRRAIAIADAISGDFASAFIWLAGVNGCALKAVAMSAAGNLISTPRRESRFTIARRVAHEYANGRN
jgi:hypothetical protein